MAEKLLNLINGHISRLEQYRGNRMPKQMWIDAFGNSGCPCMLFDNALHAYRIRVSSPLVRRPNVTAIDAHRDRTIGRLGEIEEAAAAQRSCGQGSSCQRIKARTIGTTFSFCVFIFAEQPQAQQRPTRDASQNPRHAPRVNFSRKIRFKSKIVLNQFSCVVSGMRETKMFVCLCS